MYIFFSYTRSVSKGCIIRVLKMLIYFETISNKRKVIPKDTFPHYAKEMVHIIFQVEIV